MTIHQGRIKYWNSSKGYGFIARDNAEDVFVHVSQLGQGIQPRPGLEVGFGLKQDRQGRWQAQQVHLLPAATNDTADKETAHGLQRLWRMTLVVAALLLASFILIKSVTPFYSIQGTDQRPGSGQLLPAGSPHANNPQLQHTLQLILQGGPFPYRQDNSTFQNRERLLPSQPSGYYREYTVDTPGASNRGARRVVTGGQPPEIWYYTEDHYRSFIRLEVRQ